MSGYYQQQQQLQQHPQSFPPHSAPSYAQPLHRSSPSLQSGVEYVIEPYHNHHSAYHAAYGDLQRVDAAAAGGFSSQPPSGSGGQQRKRDRDLYEAQSSAAAAGGAWPPSSPCSSSPPAHFASPYPPYPSPSPYSTSGYRPPSPPPPPTASPSLLSSASSHKRSRAGDALPSPVLHLRNIPAGATEADLWSLGAQFGRVVRVLIVTASAQAFMQFGGLEESGRMLAHHSTAPAFIRGSTVQLDPRYSVRQEIKEQPSTSPRSLPRRPRPLCSLSRSLSGRRLSSRGRRCPTASCCSPSATAACR